MKQMGEDATRKTHNEMSGGGSLDELQSKAVIGLLEHVEGLTKGEITENIHGQVVAPVSHVAGFGPALGVSITVSETNLLAKGADIGEDVTLHLLHGRLGKGMRQDTALAGMDLLVAGVVGVGDGVGKGIIELGLADIGLEAVDVLEGRVGVERDAVGAEADNLAVLLVHAPELEVAVALVGVVELVGIGDLGQEGAGVLGERVEEDAVDDEEGSLYIGHRVVSLFLFLFYLL